MWSLLGRIGEVRACTVVGMMELFLILTGDVCPGLSNNGQISIFTREARVATAAYRLRPNDFISCLFNISWVVHNCIFLHVWIA